MKYKIYRKIFILFFALIILFVPFTGNAQYFSFTPPSLLPLISYPLNPLVRSSQVLTTVASSPVLTSAGLTVTSLLATPPPTLLTTITVANTLLATSNWIGTWRSLITISGGEISFILTQDVLTGAITGTALFANHPLVISGFPVTGVSSPVGVASTFQLTGTYVNPFSQRLFTITFNCNVISSTIITGTYSIYNPLQSDYGTMDLIRP
ncbi:MAG: hypothetical protein ACMUJM_13830 [bacterium]